MARGLLGRNSNLHIRQRRRDALKEADLVILAGMVSLLIKKEILTIIVFGFIFILILQFGGRFRKYKLDKNFVGKVLN